jgi:hypothetical protein
MWQSRVCRPRGRYFLLSGQSTSKWNQHALKHRRNSHLPSEWICIHLDQSRSQSASKLYDHGCELGWWRSGSSHGDRKLWRHNWQDWCGNKYGRRKCSFFGVRISNSGQHHKTKLRRNDESKPDCAGILLDGIHCDLTYLGRKATSRYATVT